MFGWLRAAIARASRSNRALNCAAEIFIATVRSSRVSRALKTSPMPPFPICERISYGPSRVPLDNDIAFQTFYALQAPDILKRSLRPGDLAGGVGSVGRFTSPAA